MAHRQKDQEAFEKTLTEMLSKKASTVHFTTWLVGDTPLISHAWSKKAKEEMLAKQTKSVKQGRAVRDPKQDFKDSLYEMGGGIYGFPVTGFKNAIIANAHKDKGLARTTLEKSLFLHGEMTRVGPALKGAICDMPLVRIWGSEPLMREDMVRVGSGLNKTATLAYRAQFSIWACRIDMELNTSMVPTESLLPIINDAGLTSGVGEWRNERKGMFGAFHIASPEEARKWEEFSKGKAPLPGIEKMAVAAE